MGCIQACAGREKDEDGSPPPAQFPQFSSRLAQSASSDNVSRASGRRKKGRGNSSRAGDRLGSSGATPADTAPAHPTKKKAGKHKKGAKHHPDNSNSTPEGDVPAGKKKSSKKKKRKGKTRDKAASQSPGADASGPATPQPKAAAAAGASLCAVSDAPAPVAAPLPAPPLSPGRTPTDLADLSLRQRQLIQYFWNHAMHTASVVQPLYSRIGGSAAVQAAVNLFYTKVLSDARVNGFF
eukprot:Rhum_TRINITY_DN1179_c0_g1::Rhum_TRINITY_DN1179_c0_g1_i1::g.3548::m.3548